MLKSFKSEWLLQGIRSKQRWKRGNEDDNMSEEGRVGERKSRHCAVETVEIVVSVVPATRPEWRAKYRDKETGECRGKGRKGRESSSKYRITAREIYCLLLFCRKWKILVCGEQWTNSHI